MIILPLLRNEGYMLGKIPPHSCFFLFFPHPNLLFGHSCWEISSFYYGLFISGALYYVLYSLGFIAVPLQSVTVSLTLRSVSVCLHLFAAAEHEGYSQ